MNTTNDNDARCNRSITKYPSVYQEGRRAFENGGCSDDIPYKTGTKANSDRRVAWYSGYYDARTEQWEKDHEERRNNSGISK